jgi:hypothetical protein
VQYGCGACRAAVDLKAAIHQCGAAVEAAQSKSVGFCHGIVYIKTFSIVFDGKFECRRCKMNEDVDAAGLCMFEYIIEEFLYNAKEDEFFLRVQPVMRSFGIQMGFDTGFADEQQLAFDGVEAVALFFYPP